MRHRMRQTSEMSKSCVTLKIKQHKGLPFEDIIGARSGVEQIRQAVLYTQQQPERSCQLSSFEIRREWIFTNVYVFNILNQVPFKITNVFFPTRRHDRYKHSRQTKVFT